MRHANIRGHPATEIQNFQYPFLTTYDWPSLSFSLLASACFFFSASDRDGCLVPLTASAWGDLAQSAAAAVTSSVTLGYYVE
jgi:hypothetical protein